MVVPERELGIKPYSQPPRRLIERNSVGEPTGVVWVSDHDTHKNKRENLRVCDGARVSLATFRLVFQEGYSLSGLASGGRGGGQG